jgi:hypothetical protein
LPWTEIDFPEDYERAVNDVLPAIERSQRGELAVRVPVPLRLAAGE